jgi:hypothetical protein
MEIFVKKEASKLERVSGMFSRQCFKDMKISPWKINHFISALQSLITNVNFFMGKGTTNTMRELAFQ